jgi:AraC-like DNA-binding protein
MQTATFADTRGILTPGAVDRVFRLDRRAPSPDLAHVVDRYWMVEWSLPEGESHVQETLPFPSVHLTVQRGFSGVFGVPRSRFTVRLEGSGHVLGVRFRPGAFHAFVPYPVSRLADRRLDLRDVFGPAGDDLERRILAMDGDDERVSAAESFLRERAPAEPDDTVEQVNRLIQQVVDDRSITRVDELVARAGVSKRTLQRTFARYVGASPKWVIQRYRLQEAAERLATGEAVSLAELALDLGYCDQAHFIHDFKALVGLSPTEYARKAAGSG